MAIELSDPPTVDFTPHPTGGVCRVALRGRWILRALPSPAHNFKQQLVGIAGSNAEWDLTGISRLDSAGAVLLWQAWGEKWPALLRLTPEVRSIIERVVSTSVPPKPEASVTIKGVNRVVASVETLGAFVLKGGQNLVTLLTLVGQIVLDLKYLMSHPSEIPAKEFSANLFKSGAMALPVTALVGFLIGVVLSYLSSLQLKTFGADIYIVNLLGISIIRELGPVIVAVLVAGRSGSSMTAQIGVMRVTQEIDALATMGISRSIRLVLPKVMALACAMPLLVVWCSAAGLLGGMVSANFEMGLSYGYFIQALPKAVPIANLWIGMGKGVFFGFLIALVACHFGLKVRPNTESLSARTTSAVVTAITVVIVIDALFAVVTRNIGMPGGG